MSRMAKHHSGNDPNDTQSRIKHAGVGPFSHSIPAKHVFGTEEEIAHRVGGTFSTSPGSAPTNFKQIGPKPPGSNVNDHKPATHSGNQKFGNPRRYA